MAVPASSSVSAGLAQVARMGRRERESAVRQLRQQSPVFGRMLSQVDRCRVVAFASGLALLVAVVFLAGGEPVWLTGALVITGLSGFGSVSVRMTDSRFDVLLAVLGEHWAEQLGAEQLGTEQLGTEQLGSGALVGGQPGDEGHRPGPGPAIPQQSCHEDECSTRAC